jgi:hypothetical protein
MVRSTGQKAFVIYDRELFSQRAANQQRMPSVCHLTKCNTKCVSYNINYHQGKIFYD